jgi:LPXTG-motif cell wall-anchored protein
MRSKPLAKLLLVLAGLLLVVAPAARAAETLVLTCTVCTKLVVTGKDLPANSEVRVGVVDVKTGQETTGQFTVATDANGAFVKSIPMDLGEHPALESTVWKKDGSVLVVAAHTRFTAPCKPEDTLAFTGSHTPLLLGLGLALLAAGGLLVRGSRRRAYRPVT